MMWDVSHDTAIFLGVAGIWAVVMIVAMRRGKTNTDIASIKSQLDNRYLEQTQARLLIDQQQTDLREIFRRVSHLESGQTGIKAQIDGVDRVVRNIEGQMEMLIQLHMKEGPNA